MYNWKKKKKKDNNIPVVVSGENFTLIHPEIGVVVTSEENTKKEGGMEFSQKFNKPSMEEFSKMVIASQNLNSKRFLSMSIDSTQNENIPYQGYKKQFGADTNPLIENAQRILGMNLKDTTSQLPSLIKSTDIKNNYRYNPFISENYSSMKLGNDINNIKSYLEETESERKLINTKILMKGKEEQIQNINLFNKKENITKVAQLELTQVYI